MGCRVRVHAMTLLSAFPASPKLIMVAENQRGIFRSGDGGNCGKLRQLRKLRKLR
jgi:hypothetical protein